MIWIPVAHRAGKKVMRAHGSTNLPLAVSANMMRRWMPLDTQDNTKVDRNAPTNDATAFRDTANWPTVWPTDMSSQLTTR